MQFRFQRGNLFGRILYRTRRQIGQLRLQPRKAVLLRLDLRLERRVTLYRPAARNHPGQPKACACRKNSAQNAAKKGSAPSAADGGWRCRFGRAVCQSVRDQFGVCDVFRPRAFGQGVIFGTLVVGWHRGFLFG